MLKKASIISSNGCLHACSCLHPVAGSTSPSCLPQPRTRPASKRLKLSTWRGYADVRHGGAPDFRDNMHWPTPKTPTSAPTPYEIFDLPRGSSYSKHKFYELVKIYHPDRNAHEGAASIGLSNVEMVERYRLVILAHEILSDPVKRRAYDSYGAGWGQHEKHQVSRHSRGFTSAAGQTYGTGKGDDNSPFANATWEDWERWYRRSESKNDKQTYGGNYINPNAFASFVLLMAVISGVAQATRAGQYSGSLEEKAQAFTEETSRFLTTRAEQYNENKLKSDGRVKHFLEKRDPSLWGLKDDENEFYKKHFEREMPKKAPKKAAVVDPD